MILKAEMIHKKAKDVLKRCGTGDTVKIAENLGIHVHFLGNLNQLLGMYTYRQKERHILLNANMDDRFTQMVCAHEIGHDILHREIAKSSRAIPEFVLFDIRSYPEYEANAFASHLLIDDDELIGYMRQGFDIVKTAALMQTNVNLMLIKLNELNRMGENFNLPYLPHPDFLKNIRPEENQ